MSQNTIGFLRSPVTDLERKFARFHRQNPEVYAELESRARRLVAAGAERFGISLLIESMRYSWAVEGKQFRVSNSLRSLYSRLLLHNCPWLDGILETRYAPALHGDVQEGN